MASVIGVCVKDGLWYNSIRIYGRRDAKWTHLLESNVDEWRDGSGFECYCRDANGRSYWRGGKCELP
jgi:hypothetical protein